MVVLAACGGGTGQTGAESTGSATPDQGAAPTASPTASPTAMTGPAPTDSSTYLPRPEPELTLPATRLGTLERVSGVVGAGVEHNCRLLTPDRGGNALLLLVENPRVVPGTRVTVEGYRQEGVATTCQQGVPFTVLNVSDISPATPTN